MTSLDTRRVETARRAVAVVFLLNGLAFASWVARIPALRDTLDLTPGGVGLLLLCLSGGTFLALPMTGLVISWLGPARSVTVAAVASTVGLLTMATGLATVSLVTVGVGMFTYGIGTSSWDVAMNVEAADVERRLGRTLMPRFHAAFSLGSVLGALTGAVCAGLAIDLPAQMVGTVVVMMLAVLPAVRLFLPVATPEPDAPAPRSPLRAWLEPRTLVIGLLVLAFALSEGVANDWVALALVDGYDASEAVGAAGFAVFVTAMTFGRLFGGSAIERFGRVPVLRVTALLVIAGVAAVVLSPGLVGAFAGAVLWGIGASLGFPLGMTVAADDESHAAGRLAVVSSIGYAAFLGGPPLVGLLADQIGVRSAIVVAGGAAVLGLVVSGVARPRVPVPVDR